MHHTDSYCMGETNAECSDEKFLSSPIFDFLEIWTQLTQYIDPFFKISMVSFGGAYKVPH